MSDDSSTPKAADSDGGTAPVPSDEEQQPLAEVSQSEGSDAQDTSVTESEDTNDTTEDNNEEVSDELDSWAQSQGIDIENPTPEQMRNLAKRFRDTQSKMHQVTQSTSELRDTINDVADEEISSQEFSEIEQLRAQMEKERLDRRATEFFIMNPDAKQYDQKMAELVRKKPWLANDLNDLYSLAKQSSMQDVYSQARREERSSLAQQQQTASAQSSARSTSTGGSRITRQLVASMTPAEYRERSPEIQQALRENGGILPEA